MLDIKREISPYNHYEGNKVEYIVIHYTGNINDTAKNNADYFYGGNRNASAHYFVDDNEIYKVVEEYNGAWHCGDGNNRCGINNRNSIAIEMCGTDNGRISEKTVENTLELTKHLMKKYGIDKDHVVRHYDASRKNCPSAFNVNNWSRWWNFKDRLLKQNSSNNQSDYKNGEYNCNVKIIADVLNVRDSRPQNGNLGNIIGQLKSGQIIKVGYCLNNWFGVVLNGKQGFISGKYIQLSTKNEEFKNGDYSERKARVIADVLNVRYDRGTQYNVIGQVKNGDIVNLQYCLNGWISIEGFKGNKGLGYVSSEFLELI
ncbi:N-acetylmuramoyl-L-alanine amidase [Paraclostridium sordellii]|uniref:N-acetylmuramoyl-L-alanine amidase n=1 Tax=Paraclostridium sordellii TaxID=1505 RepID=UPI0005E6CFF1|nr:N-acetylmuramoyl-L-alanine amidase [Paeniclostridium sordellii]CEN21228.1 N-acetylmuramoyl-L-alanine amidase family 2 protein [[Clostridium] sordellii] [Paeniclostridium sordellii]